MLQRRKLRHRQGNLRIKPGMLPSRKGVWSTVLQGGELVTGLLSKAVEARRGGPSRVVTAGSFRGCRKDCSAGVPGTERLCREWGHGSHLPSGQPCCPVGATM